MIRDWISTHTRLDPTGFRAKHYAIYWNVREKILRERIEQRRSCAMCDNARTEHSRRLKIAVMNTNKSEAVRWVFSRTEDDWSYYRVDGTLSYDPTNHESLGKAFIAAVNHGFDPKNECWRVEDKSVITVYIPGEEPRTLPTPH